MHRLVQHLKITSHEHYIRPKKNHMIVSTDTEKASHKIQQPFVIQTLNKLGIEENFHHWTKNIYKKTYSLYQLNSEKPDTLFLQDQNKKKHPPPRHRTGVPANAVR